MKAVILFLSLSVIGTFSKNIDTSVPLFPSRASKNFENSRHEGVGHLQCGKNPLVKSGPKVTSGRPCDPGDWPWMAAIFVRNTSTNTILFQCGASLIASNWVLTAAHCIPDTSKNEILEYVRLGDVDIDPTVADGANPIEIKIGKAIKHPNYSAYDYTNPIRNDIALLQLNEHANFSDYIFPICLHSGTQYVTNKTVYDGKKAFIAGWGTTSTHTSYNNGTTTTRLHDAALNTKSYTECNQSYAIAVKNGLVKVDETIVCSYAPEKDACKHDSGGPLMFIETGPDRKPVWWQGGIVSHGFECGRDDYPGMYTKVAAFIDWINKSTGLKF